jgi:hypothetical protein
VEIALIAYGSRGDVQPFVALARALRQVGQQVRLLAPPTFASLAVDHDIPFAPTGADIEAHLRSRIQTVRATGAVSDPVMRERAAQLGAAIQAEQGTEQALEHISHVLRRAQKR